MSRLPWRREAGHTASHDSPYAGRLNTLLTPGKEYGQGVRVGHDLLALLETEVGDLDVESYYLTGALAAASTVVLYDTFRPGVYHSLPTDEAAAIKQRMTDTLEGRLKKGFSKAVQYPHQQLHWAAAYVALEGAGFWDESDAAFMKTEVAPWIRRHRVSEDKPVQRTVGQRAADFRIVFEEQLLSSARQRGRITDAVFEELEGRTRAAFGQPAGFSRFNTPSYAALAACVRVFQAREIHRTPEDPNRGITIVDPPFRVNRKGRPVS